MKYNPNIHRRRSIRLKGYDYSRAGLYFITICCQGRICRFGQIENNEMQLNEYGRIASGEWIKLPERFNNMQMDVFQIMPNHMHGIISLRAPVGATLAVAPVEKTGDRDGVNSRDGAGTRGAGASPAPTGKTVGDIVGAYKSLVANRCLETYKSKYESAGTDPGQIPRMGKLWQRNYHEHIIRDEQSYHRIARYIINNPANWKNDKFHHP